MKSLARYLTSSTLKREFASFVFLVWLGLSCYLTIRLPITQLAPDASLAAWLTLAPYMFALVTAAFGADWVAKQTNIAGPPANTATTVTAEVTDNSATVTTSSEPKQ
jgi:hypothetical protein